MIEIFIQKVNLRLHLMNINVWSVMSGTENIPTQNDKLIDRH